jgi:alkaline phosphatase
MTRHRPLRSSSLALVVLASLACTTADGASTAGASLSAPAIEDRTPPAPDAPHVRNVILVIADGMGPSHLALPIQWARHAPGADGHRLHLERLFHEGSAGWMLTEPADGLVADSAASATQLATGRPARSETLGIDVDGNPVATVLTLARDSGRATGLVTDTRLTHATPAAFAAHQPHRSLEDAIASDLLENEVDVLLGGGWRHFLPEAATDGASEIHTRWRPRLPGGMPIGGRRTDGRDVLAEAEAAGWSLAFDRQSLETEDGPRILGLFASSGMPDAIAVHRSLADAGRTMPTLAELTRKSLEILSRNETGFFLMVEAGQIDWAAHDNDAGRLLHEMLVLDEALGVILDWTEGRDDTLVVLTADHETGGFGLSYSAYGLPPPKPLAGPAFTDRPYRPDWNFGRPEQLDRLHAQTASFDAIFAAFDALPEADRTEAALERLVGIHVPFPFDLEAARSVLARRPNPYPDASATETVPAVHDFDAFYPYGEDSRRNLLGRALAREQNVVWSTGTHTAAPVPLLSAGPKAVRARFTGLLHATEVGLRLQDALGLVATAPQAP